VPLTFARTSNSESETALVGRALGAVLRPGDVVLLDGSLGAGKTTLVRAVAAGMGLAPGAVSSPTFVIVHQYGEPARLTHIDAYRLRGAEDLESLGWDLLDPVTLGRDGPVLMVEWSERLPGAFTGAARIRIEHASETTREFTFEVPDDWAARPGFAALRARGPTVCPITGKPVGADSPTYPFADERARLADLNRWFTGSYTVSRDATEADLQD
jgi:tRNA threonylcarbamoyladenosine biosynthesis protein TsaE